MMYSGLCYARSGMLKPITFLAGVNVKTTKTNPTTAQTPRLSPQEQEAQLLKRRKAAKRKRTMRVIDRIFGFFLATGIVLGVSGLALEYVLVKGPSPALAKQFVNTMHETRRFGFISHVFLSDEEVEAMVSGGDEGVADFDSSLITIASQQSGEGDSQQADDGADKYGLSDEDGDGIIYTEVKGKTYAGHMIIVLDPSRVFCGRPDNYGGVGLTLEQMVDKYDAIGGINAGGFLDENGAGFGGLPQGITYIDGECVRNETDGCAFAGFDENNILHVGYLSYEETQAAGIRDGASFGPVLVINGEIAQGDISNSGVNPRTAIGQRADGAVLMLAIDGRQTHSMGATYQDIAEIMLDFGAVNACNLDGGSSTCMYMNGAYVNKCSAAGGLPRPLPSCFLFK